MPDTSASLAGAMHRGPEKKEPIDPSHAEAFKRYRTKSNLSQTQLAEQLGYKSPSFIANIENCLCSQEIFEGIIKKLSFPTVEAFLAAEAAMPDTPASLAGGMYKGGDKKELINPSHAEAFKRYRTKSNLTQGQLAERLEYKTPTSIVHIEQGLCSQELFETTLTELNFPTVEAFLDAEAAMPDTRASRSGGMPRGRRCGS